MATNAPKWLNVDALIDEGVIAALEEARVEAEALAPAIRQLAIHAYRASHAFESALSGHSLPDELWEVMREVTGAAATFQVLTRLIDDLEIGRLENPEGDPPEWYRRELGLATQTACGSADDLDATYQGGRLIEIGSNLAAPEVLDA